MHQRQYNLLTKSFEWLHEVKPGVMISLMAECDYLVGLTAKQDGIEIIGEITDKDANIHEVSDKIIKSEFQQKYETEIAEIRKEVIQDGMNGRKFLAEESQII